MKKVIIYGITPDVGHCVEFFGKENVLYIVQDAKPKDGALCHGCTLKAFADFASSCQGKQEDGVSCDVILAIRHTNIGGILSLTDKLKKLGCNFSIWQDVQKRWATGEQFLARDRERFPYERESLFAIGHAQYEYLYKHTDPSSLLPATGSLRNSQLEALHLTKAFQAEMEDENIKFCMIGGTLIGACRHKGFVPWDIDLDFAVLQPGFDKLVEKLEAKKDTQCFYLAGYNKSHQPATPVFQTVSGSTALDAQKKYFCRIGYGYIKVMLNTGKSDFVGNKLVCDVFPLYCFADTYAEADFQLDLQYYFQNRNTNGVALYREYDDTMKKRGAIVNPGNKIGFGHPFLSSMMAWFAAFWHTFKMLPASDYLPLQKIQFEDTYFWGPANPEKFLEMVGYMKFQQLPKNLPFDHHASESVKDKALLQDALEHLAKKFG